MQSTIQKIREMCSDNLQIRDMAENLMESLVIGTEEQEGLADLDINEQLSRIMRETPKKNSRRQWPN